MNTIPLIFNENQIDFTVLGSKASSVSNDFPVSVVLLNSGGSHLRIQNIENLITCGFKSIISIETNEFNYNLEDYIKKFPSVKFVLPREESSTGELINIAVSLIDSKYFLVVRDTLKITKTFFNKNIAAKILDDNTFCVCPRLVLKEAQSLPVYSTPGVKKSRFYVEYSSSCSKRADNLYPYDLIGIYNRKKFIDLGGFDYTIKSAYWQNLDLALRAWLWGEKCQVEPMWSIEYLENLPEEEKISNQYQYRFYVKNLLAKFKNDHGEIPFFSLLPLIGHSNCSIVETFRYFKLASVWVKKNSYRFVQDAVTLVTQWGKNK